MKKILYLSIVLFFASCSTKNQSNVVLFNNINFKLHDSEKKLLIDSLSQQIFQSNFNNSNIQIPLFKVIKGNDYFIFLGVPINTSLKKLIQFKSTITPPNTAIITDSNSYFFTKYKIGEEYKMELSKSFDNNIIYIIGSTKSSIVFDSLFKKDIILDRFN
jgi:hypothetical protein